MKILVYADTHFANKNTQKELEISPDYSQVVKFLSVIDEEKPDKVVCLGDFAEDYYDTTYPGLDELILSLKGKTDIYLKGNHDSRGLPITTIDGVVYGHSRGDIQGHTHKPSPTNVGSLTINGTYGVAIDGKFELKHL